jgi:hypothetical protein
VVSAGFIIAGKIVIAQSFANLVAQGLKQGTIAVAGCVNWSFAGNHVNRNVKPSGIAGLFCAFDKCTALFST